MCRCDSWASRETVSVATCFLRASVAFLHIRRDVGVAPRVLTTGLLRLRRKVADALRSAIMERCGSLVPVRLAAPLCALPSRVAWLRSKFLHSDSSLATWSMLTPDPLGRGHRRRRLGACRLRLGPQTPLTGLAAFAALLGHRSAAGAGTNAAGRTFPWRVALPMGRAFHVDERGGPCQMSSRRALAGLRQSSWASRASRGSAGWAAPPPSRERLQGRSPSPLPNWCAFAASLEKPLWALACGLVDQSHGAPPQGRGSGRVCSASWSSSFLSKTFPLHHRSLRSSYRRLQGQGRSFAMHGSFIKQSSCRSVCAVPEAAGPVVSACFA